MQMVTFTSSSYHIQLALSSRKRGIMSNTDVRLAAKGAGVPLWKIADYIGISEATLTRLLRKPLDETIRKKLFEAIDVLKSEGM